MKKCSTCQNIKEDIDFAKSKSTKSGLQHSCKLCRKNMRLANLEKFSQRDKESYQKNRDKKLQYQKEYQQVNRTERLEYLRKYQAEHKLELREKQLVYTKTNQKHINKVKAKRKYERYHNDINYKLSAVLRCRFIRALKGNAKRGSAVRDLGCTIEEFKVYIENKFKVGMTWDNWSRDVWHLDHKIPLCAFDLNNPIELKKAVHYTNLQPLWATENLKKNGNLNFIASSSI